MVPTCTWCGTDEYIDDYDPAEDLAWCVGPGHIEPRMFQPKAEAKALAAANKLAALPEGMATELGLWTQLPALLSHGEWVDTNVVEYRYGIVDPDGYRQMLDRWGHVKQGPRKYSVSSYIGATLGHLSRSTNVTYKAGSGSGFFAYNSAVGFWTLEPVPAETIDVGWKHFATQHNLDANDWPLA